MNAEYPYEKEARTLHDKLSSADVGEFGLTITLSEDEVQALITAIEVAYSY